MHRTLLQGFQKLRRTHPSLLLVGPALLWFYWPTLCELVQRWAHDPKYSHSYIVPFFAFYLGWSRMRQAGISVGRSTPWGLPVIAAGVALHLVGVVFYLPWISEISILPLTAGIILLLSGWQSLKLCLPAIAFLIFMVPLPYRLEVAVAHPLQRIGTVASTYILQMLGFMAHADGNVIVIKQIRINVIEACSGLSMLMIFFALCTAVVLLVQRPILDKALIVLSAVPIALVCNIVRITVTGALHVLVGQRLADLVFHDLAGWLMIVLALGLLWLELKTLDWVLVEKQQQPERLDLRRFGIAPSRPMAAAPRSNTPVSSVSAP